MRASIPWRHQNIPHPYISIYIKLQSVCLCVCSCLFAGLTAARINLIFCIHIHIWSDCAIGYMILTFEVIKGHFRSNKFLCKVPLAEGEILPPLGEGRRGDTTSTRGEIKSSSALTGKKHSLKDF